MPFWRKQVWYFDWCTSFVTASHERINKFCNCVPRENSSIRRAESSRAAQQLSCICSRYLAVLSGVGVRASHRKHICLNVNCIYTFRNTTVCFFLSDELENNFWFVEKCAWAPRTSFAILLGVNLYNPLLRATCAGKWNQVVFLWFITSARRPSFFHA